MGADDPGTIVATADHSAVAPRGWLRAATGRRTAWLFALLPLLVGVALIGLGQGERDRLPADQLPSGYDSTRAVELAEQLPETDDKIAVVVFSADSGKLSAEQLDGIDDVVGSVTGQTPRVLPSQDGTAALAVVPVAATDATAVAERGRAAPRRRWPRTRRRASPPR